MKYAAWRHPVDFNNHLWDVSCFKSFKLQLWHYISDTSVVLMMLHLVFVLWAGELILHGTGGCPHGSLLSCCLDMRVFPGSRGPFLLSFGEAGTSPSVEIMDLKSTWDYKEMLASLKRKENYVFNSSRQIYFFICLFIFAWSGQFWFVFLKNIISVV